VPRRRPLYAVSLFSGAGGLDLGIERAGFLIRVQVEKDRWCLKTLAANRTAFRSRKLVTIGTDIRRLSPLQILAAGGLRSGNVALLLGGPPCQSFSYAGLRSGLKDFRGLLVSEFIRMLEWIQPELFLFENVPGFADVPVAGRRRVEPLVNWFVRKCASAGYAVTWGVVDAADFGAPQHRERFVALGCRQGCPPSFPEPTHGPKGYRHYVTLRTALRGVDEHTCGLGGLAFSPWMQEILTHVPPGGDWRTLPEDVKVLAMGKALEDRGGKTGFWRRLSWDEPSPTVVRRPDHKGTCLCHPT
jgi:DNA (cytosine-5)-methyltransferase 1